MTARPRQAESGAVRNLFDLRMIIGGLFVVYGVYLTIRGRVRLERRRRAGGRRAHQPVDRASSRWPSAPRFVAWALLRPLTLEEIVEGQARASTRRTRTTPCGEERERAARGARRPIKTGRVVTRRAGGRR